MAYYLQTAGLDYVIFERNDAPGSFFEVYPRRRTLISINKRNTGETNTAFNMRHDWNSLLSDDPEMLFKHYSNEMFPHADALVEYLQDYVDRFSINIQYQTNIDFVTQDPVDNTFALFTTGNDVYNCRYLVASTGIPVLTKFAHATGTENVEGYDTVSHSPEDYEGQKVLILGKGNTGFETADMIYGHTDYVHLISRDRVKLSWATHYVGDLRGINNELLDTYQLKSLDALLERNVDTDGVEYELRDGKIFIPHLNLGPYDRVINCMGFNYDPEPFRNLTSFESTDAQKKFPNMGWDFQSSSVNNLYYAGAITHGLDKRISSGGFIHGFRYSSRALARILAARNHQMRWPSTRVPMHGVVNMIKKRLNEMSGPYQMFYVMVDVYVRYEDHVELFEEVPHGMLHRMHELLVESRDTPLDMIVIRLEYGAGFSEIGGDPFKIGRVELHPLRAHTCNFIHPVLYHFTELPHVVPLRSAKMMGYRLRMHLSEDLYTDFATFTRHHPALSNFIGTAWNVDLSFYSADECLLLSLTTSEIPAACKNTLMGHVHVDNEKELNTEVRVSPELTKCNLSLEDMTTMNMTHRECLLDVGSQSEGY